MLRAALVGGVAIAAGASAAVLHPIAGLGLVLAFAALVWTLSNALNATLAFALVLFLRPIDFFPPLAVIQPAKLLAFVALFSWLITKLLHGEVRVSRAPHGKWILALAVGALLSSIMGSYPRGSLEMFTESFVKALILYGLLVHLVDTKAGAVKLHLTFALCTVGLALYSIYQRSAGLANIEGVRAGFVGLLGDPNDLALVLLMYVPLFTELALGTRGIRRLPWGLLLAILITGVFVTVSRGGAFGLLAALAFTFWDRGRLSLRLLLVPVLTGAVFGGLLLAGVNDRSSGALTPGQLDGSAQGRLDAWEVGIRMIIDNPVFGVGLDRFVDHFESYSTWAVFIEGGPKVAHNSFIHAAAETGLVGFIPFMALVVLTLRSARHLRKAYVPEDSPMERAVRRSLFPSMAGFCVAAFFLSQCWGWFFFIMFAQSAALHEIWRPEVDGSSFDGRVGTVRASMARP